MRVSTPTDEGLQKKVVRNRRQLQAHLLNKQGDPSCLIVVPPPKQDNASCQNVVLSITPKPAPPRFLDTLSFCLPSHRLSEALQAIHTFVSTHKDLNSET
jgi:hypothetical protein